MNQELYVDYLFYSDLCNAKGMNPIPFQQFKKPTAGYQHYVEYCARIGVEPASFEVYEATLYPQQP